MAANIDFIKDRVVVNLSGFIDQELMVHLNEQIRDHPSYEEFKYQYWHVSKDAAIELDANGLKALIAIPQQPPYPHPDLKIAIVTSSQLAYGLSRMYSAYADQTPWETAVFSDPYEADLWLMKEDCTDLVVQ